jgi:hypothetical protein
VAYNNEVTGESNPMWREDIKNGSNATTTLNGWRTHLMPLKINVHEYMAANFKPNPAQVYPTGGSTRGAYAYKPYYAASDYTIENLPWSKADNLAKANFIKKVRQTQTSFQGGVFLGELSEAMLQIRSPVRSLRKGVSNYLDAVKTRAKSARRIPNRKKRNSSLREMVSDTWLEYSFGWSPLLNDIEDGARTIADAIHREDITRKMVVGYGEDKIMVRNQSNEVSISAGTLPFISMSLRYYTKAQVKYYGLVGVNTYSAANLQRIGFSRNDVLPTLWELVPYSFLVDYFVNVDDIIDAASLTDSGIMWTSRTIRLSNEVEAYAPVTHLTTSSSYQITGTASASSGIFYKRTSISRSRYFGSLVPSLQFSLPTSPKKLLNIAALWATSNSVSRYIRGD